MGRGGGAHGTPCDGHSRGVCFQGYYPSNKPGVEPKRPCRPINLTHLMYLSSATNRITVTWGNYGKVSRPRNSLPLPSLPCPPRLHWRSPDSPPLPHPQSYSVALYLVRQLTSSELLQRLKTIGVKHPELCKALGEPRGFLHCWVGLPTVPGGGHGSITADPVCWAQGTGLVLRSLLPVGDLDLPSLAITLVAGELWEVSGGCGRRRASQAANHQCKGPEAGTSWVCRKPPASSVNAARRAGVGGRGALEGLRGGEDPR